MTSKLIQKKKKGIGEARKITVLGIDKKRAFKDYTRSIIEAGNVSI